MADSRFQRLIRSQPRPVRIALGTIFALVAVGGAVATTVHRDWDVWKVLECSLFVAFAVISFATRDGHPDERVP
jgi:hypothetical protein